MAHLKYPKTWAGAASEGLIINYSELTALCVANGLGANIAYIAEQMRMSAMGTVNRILESAPTQSIDGLSQANVNNEEK